MKSNIKALMEGKMTPQEIIRDHLLLFTSEDDPRPNDKTTICPELVKLIIQDFKDWGGLGRRLCYYDKESNQIKNGIPFRNETSS